MPPTAAPALTDSLLAPLRDTAAVILAPFDRPPKHQWGYHGSLGFLGG
jgi:hypothetical protein